MAASSPQSSGTGGCGDSSHGQSLQIWCIFYVLVNVGLTEEAKGNRATGTSRCLRGQLQDWDVTAVGEFLQVLDARRISGKDYQVHAFTAVKGAPTYMYKGCEQSNKLGLVSK